MQNPTPAAPVSPAVPQPAAAVEVWTPGQTRPINEAEIAVLRRQRSEMSNQLSSARERRGELINEIRVAPDGTEQGLLLHLQVVNDRIVSIERDLERSGQTLRSGQVPIGTTLIAPRFQSPTDAAERGAAISALVLVPLFLSFMVMRWRRGKRRGEKGAPAPEHDARMERLEQAVDAIALEIERVGESQRFTQKVLAEANIMPALGVGQRAAEPIRMPAYEEIRSRTPDR